MFLFFTGANIDENKKKRKEKKKKKLVNKGFNIKLMIQ